MKRIRKPRLGYQQLECRRMLATLSPDGGIANPEPITKVQHEPPLKSQLQKSKKLHDDLHQPIVIVDCWFGHEMTKEVLMDCWKTANTNPGA